ncbi:hypothetical protein WN51_01387, partial [Melipona quadrifasciata]
VPCFAHCLQLAVKQGLKKFELYNHVRRKCKKMVTFFSRSTTAKNKLITAQKNPSTNNKNH